jgi:hypothetical protein
MELYRPIRFKSKSKSKKRLSDNPTKINKKTKRTNLKLQRILHFISIIQEKQYKSTDQNKQLSSMYQQEIQSIEFVSNNQENMDRNQMFIKVVHTPGKLNVTTDKLSRLEMNRDYYLLQENHIYIRK